MLQSFETLRIGIASTNGSLLDVRVVRGSGASGAYFVVSLASAHGPFDGMTEALTFCTQMFSDLSWRDRLELCPGEVDCPVCTAPLPKSPRYPRGLCPVCVLEAVDREGQSLRFYTSSVDGSFFGRRADGGTTRHHACWVRGRPCWADEAYLGGIIVQPVDDGAHKP